ncbi:MAG: 4-hydroxy-tetrahydrodipicolinate synthase [Spirochaetia bacterium]|nr:4-hydroxy-tetrahydrodipicolinate synthase [Spirochaetia bacterium]MCF7945518.1 4-hydroxy-tetrahydrodipicolinate synthase [Spirochaetia bacterium]
MFKPEGVFTALITPMNDDESINFDQLRLQIDRQIEEGAAGLFCLGTNGEFYALDIKERVQLVDEITDYLKGRLPLIVNVGCVTTKGTIALAQETVKRPVDALSVIVPYYAALTQQQLYDHFSTVAKQVDAPIMMYNIPKRTGNAIALETVKRLAAINNIIGIKDSSGDIEFVNELIGMTNENFSLLVGTDSLILQTLNNGGSGAVAACANPFPTILNGIYNNWKKGDLSRAKVLQESIVPFRQTFAHGNPNSVVKRSLELMGFAVGPARSPANIISSDLDTIIMNAVSQVEQRAKQLQ